MQRRQTKNNARFFQEKQFLTSRLLVWFGICFTCIPVYAGIENLIERDFKKSAGPAIESEITPPGVPGGRSLLFDFSDQARSQGYSMDSRRIPIDPLQSYRLSSWLKTDRPGNGYGAILYYSFFNKDGNVIYGSSYHYVKYWGVVFSHSAPLNWKYYSHELHPDSTPGDSKFGANEIPHDAVSMTIGLGAPHYKGRAWFTPPVLEEHRLGGGALLPGDEKLYRLGSGYRDDFRRTICSFEASEAVNQLTRFSITTDEKDLHISIQCEQPQHTITPGSQLSIWGGDYVDIFIDPSGTRSEKFFQLTVTPDGHHSLLWNASKLIGVVETKVKVGENSWTASIAVPLDTLHQMPTESGLVINKNCWSFNMARRWAKGGENEYSSWSYSGGSFGVPKNFGFTFFTDVKPALVGYWSKPLNVDVPAIGENDLPYLVSQKQILEKAVAAFSSDAEAIKAAEEVDFSRLYRRQVNLRQAIKEQLLKVQRTSYQMPPERKKFGFVLWQLPLLTEPSSELFPVQDALINSITARGAVGARIATQFGLFSTSNLNDLTFKIEDLIDEHGKKMPVDLRIVRNGIMTTDSRIEIDDATVQYADQSRFVSVAEKNNALVLHLHANGETPGVYRGQLVISSQDMATDTIPVTFTVLPFKIAQHGKTYGFFYTGVLKKPNSGNNAPPYSGKLSPEAMKMELGKMFADGCRIVTLYCYATGPMNPDYCREVMKLAADVGFRQLILLGGEHIVTRGTTDQGESLREKLEVIASDAKKLGIERLYIYSVDEPRETDSDRSKQIALAAHSVGFETTTALMSDAVRAAMGKSIDLPIMIWPSSVAYTDFTTQFMQSVMRGDSHEYKQIFIYPFANSLDIRLAHGWYLYKAHFDGCIPWAWYDWGPAQRFVIPTMDDAVNTVQYEGALEGIQDISYIKTLEWEIATCSDNVKAKKAQEHLDALLNKIELEGEKMHTITPEKFHEMRQSLIDTILSLQ